MATRAAPTSTAATPGAGETHSGVRRDEVTGSAQVLCRCSCALLATTRAASLRVVSAPVRHACVVRCCQAFQPSKNLQRQCLSLCCASWS